MQIIKSKVVIIAGTLLLILITLASMSKKAQTENSVTMITLDPQTPNILLNDQYVNISFSYTTTQAGGVRIYARPFSDGSRTADYMASDAPLSPVGKGTGKQSFTIRSGNITVDQVRFQMFNADQTQIIFEAFVPVHYEFRIP
jgi:hypothetical protein